MAILHIGFIEINILFIWYCVPFYYWVDTDETNRDKLSTGIGDASRTGNTYDWFSLEVWTGGQIRYNMNISYNSNGNTLSGIDGNRDDGKAISDITSINFWNGKYYRNTIVCYIWYCLFYDYYEWENTVAIHDDRYNGYSHYYNYTLGQIYFNHILTDTQTPENIKDGPFGNNNQNSYNNFTQPDNSTNLYSYWYYRNYIYMVLRKLQLY